MPIRDTRMMAKALEQRWPLNENARKAIISRLLRIIADNQSSPREVTAAAKALLAAEKQNQSDEHKVIDVSLQRRNLELDAIATELGIEASVIVDVERESSGGNIGTQEERNEH